MHLEFSN